MATGASEAPIRVTTEPVTTGGNSRRKALTQVMGYLVLENGIYLFGITLGREAPLLVEMGVSLDVFVAVFVMGIIIFHISREFDHIDVDQLASLKD